MALQVFPAYGRDYKSAKDAIAAWGAGKDFIIADYSSPDNGRHVNKDDYPGQVRIRYKRLTRICFAGGAA